MADNTRSNKKRGLASASLQTRKRVARMGAMAQPREAKARGGRNSHGGGRRNTS